MNSLAEDSAALASAASAAEEALQLEREALSVLRDGWSGEAAAAATDFIENHCREGEAVVSALRQAAGVLAALGDSTDPAGDHTDVGLGERPPSNFSAPAPQPVAAPAPTMNWPAGGMPALPDIGGAIAGLIAQTVAAIHPDPGPADLAVESPEAAKAPSAAGPVPDPPVKPVVPQPAAVVPAAPVAAPTGATPLLAAEIPPQEPAPPVAEPAAPERTPCEIAADELPQVGE